MDYYKRKLFLAEVDKNDNVIGKIERWKTHQDGILHRGFTTVLIYKNSFIVQYRKHLAFDRFYDLTFSSHQIYINDVLQTDLEAIDQTLKREWNIDRSGLTETPKFLNKFYYKAKDPNSIFTEHEIDYIYQAELKNLPTPNLNFAYGYSLVKKGQILESKLPFAPWVKDLINTI